MTASQAREERNIDLLNQTPLAKESFGVVESSRSSASENKDFSTLQTLSDWKSFAERCDSWERIQFHHLSSRKPPFKGMSALRRWAESQTGKDSQAYRVLLCSVIPSLRGVFIVPGKISSVSDWRDVYLSCSPGKARETVLDNFSNMLRYVLQIKSPAVHGRLAEELKAIPYFSKIDLSSEEEWREYFFVHRDSFCDVAVEVGPSRDWVREGVFEEFWSFCRVRYHDNANRRDDLFRTYAGFAERLKHNCIHLQDWYDFALKNSSWIGLSSKEMLHEAGSVAKEFYQAFVNWTKRTYEGDVMKQREVLQKYFPFQGYQHGEFRLTASKVAARTGQAVEEVSAFIKALPDPKSFCYDRFEFKGSEEPLALYKRLTRAESKRQVSAHWVVRFEDLLLLESAVGSPKRIGYDPLLEL